MKSVFTTLSFGLLSSEKTTESTTKKNTLNPLLAFLHYQRIKNKNGMMSQEDIAKIFKYNNKGLVLDGKDKRLSIKDSCNHITILRYKLIKSTHNLLKFIKRCIWITFKFY